QRLSRSLYYIYKKLKIPATVNSNIYMTLQCPTEVPTSNRNSHTRLNNAHEITTVLNI
ncbi:hypothetical protein L9F63_021807, partial [Diploptera punctata]